MVQISAPQQKTKSVNEQNVQKSAPTVKNRRMFPMCRNLHHGKERGDVIKVLNKITHKELFDKFIKLNTSVTAVDWQPLLIDDCQKYAVDNQPMIRVILSDGNWLRVFISKEYNEINWY